MSRHERDAEPVRILYVIPEPAKPSPVVHSLRKREEFSFDTATTTADALEQYNSSKAYDCIVSDHSLPDVDGLTLLETVRIQNPEQPFILFTATGDETVASQAINRNVTGYLIETTVEDQIEELVNLIHDGIAYHRNRARLSDPQLVLDSIFEATPNAMAVVRNDSFIKVNQAFLDLLEVSSRDEISTIDPAKVIDCESGEFAADTIHRLEQRETFIDREEHTITAADGTIGPVELTAAPIEWNDSAAVLLIARDISVEQRRKTTLNRFKQAIEHSGHAIYITDADGTIEYVNEAFEKTTGYTASEAIGETPRILKSGEMEQDYYERLWKTVTNGGTWEEEVINRRKSGDHYVAHQTIAPVTDTDGTISAYVAIQMDITDRKEEQTQLRWFRRAAQNASDLLAAIDADNRLLFANRRYRDFHGIPEDADLSTSTVESLLEPEQYANVKERIDAALGGNRISFEITRENAAGEERILDVEYFPLRDVDGEIIGSGASMRDVTDRRELLEDVRELAEHRRVLTVVTSILMRADSAQDALSEVANTISHSELFSCTFAALINEDALEWVCTSESDLTEDRVQSFHDPEFIETVFDEGVLHINDVTEPPYQHHSPDVPSHAGIALAITHNDRNFGVLTVHLPPSASVDEIEIRLLGQLTDDLALFLYNRSLEHDYRTFQEIAERIDDPIMLQNREGQFEVINDAVSDYAGVPKEELYDTDEFAFIDAAAAEAIQEKKELVLRTETPLEYEITPEFPTKGERSFSTTRYPHYDDAGDLDGTVAICRDVTEIKEREKQMRVMDRVLRHNVNNDMNIVRGYAELIADECAETPAESYAEPIIEHSERLLGLVEKERQITATLSKKPDIQEFDLVSTLQPVVESISNEYPGVTINTELPSSCEVRGTNDIAHAVEELLENAIEHATMDEPAVELTVTGSDTEATIEVRDGNDPIPEMERAVLRGSQDVEPLLHGSGLGLWLVNHIVRSADGRLEFDELSPTGNRVKIHLPSASPTNS